MYNHMGKVVIKILQGSAVTQTVLGGLTIHLLVANFLLCTCVKNYGNWLVVDKVIAEIIWLTFLAHPVYIKVFLLCLNRVKNGYLVNRTHKCTQK